MFAFKVEVSAKKCPCKNKTVQQTNSYRTVWLIYSRHCTVHTNVYQSQSTFAEVKHKSIFGVRHAQQYIVRQCAVAGIAVLSGPAVR